MCIKVGKWNKSILWCTVKKTSKPSQILQRKLSIRTWDIGIRNNVSFTCYQGSFLYGRMWKECVFKTNFQKSRNSLNFPISIATSFLTNSIYQYQQQKRKHSFFRSQKKPNRHPLATSAAKRVLYMPNDEEISLAASRAAKLTCTRWIPILQKT